MALSDELEALAKRHGALSYRNRAAQEDALAVVDVPDQCPYFGPSSHRDVWLAGWYAARKQARRKP